MTDIFFCLMNNEIKFQATSDEHNTSIVQVRSYHPDALFHFALEEFEDYSEQEIRDNLNNQYPDLVEIEDVFDCRIIECNTI